MTASSRTGNLDFSGLHGQDSNDEDCPVCVRWAAQTMDGPGIPLFKFGSNDGWKVYPLEITSGLRLADDADPNWRADLSDLVGQFVDYLERCADEGGVLVH